MQYEDFFKQAFSGNAGAFPPFAYQARLAEGGWPDLLDVPTGMGKTAAVTLAWSWKRGWRGERRVEKPNDDTPRRLVWCLPMRVLVEQTADNIGRWLENLGVRGKAGDAKVSVHVLKGGEADLKSWAEHPEEDMILIGTQDMLLSRALMRGYGMSRYQWPIQFSLLHNDCLWVLDEVQLMGAGLATSAQLEAFRRDFPLAATSRTLWVSATLNRNWLGTVDMQPYLCSVTTFGIDDEDRKQAGDRLQAAKSLAKASTSLTREAGNKAGREVYLQALSEEVLSQHDKTAQTLVIVNQVERAQQLFRLIQTNRLEQDDLLIHGRFRAAERSAQTESLKEKGTDRIVVATQAIEAGVDMSAKTLVTELAPWSSMVQRFGRCNRYGEYNEDGAVIHWVDIEQDADASPYDATHLSGARDNLIALDSASSQSLPSTEAARPLTAVLRRKDLLDLFNTDPDLSGFDVDVSDFIRDSDTPGAQLFWREFKEDPNTSASSEAEGKPHRDELCPVSMSQIRAFHKRKDVQLWHWDTLDNRWAALGNAPRPGMVVLARASDSGYDPAIGFDATLKKGEVATISKARVAEDAFGEDWQSRQDRPVDLPDHLSHVAEQVGNLCQSVSEQANRESVVRAGRWHDLGKLHWVFQGSMYRCNGEPNAEKPLAKSDCPGPMRHARPYFRHELASMLAWLEQHDGEPDADLIAYLILAHHGKVRMSLRAMPDEADHLEGNPKRFARGVYEGDDLPALDFDDEHSDAVKLKLALMEIGEGEQGPSWTERSLALLDQYGPFRLAWLETLVRLADWRASTAEQLDFPANSTQNDTHGLENGNPRVAPAVAGGAGSTATGEPAPQSGAQHGVRGRAGQREDAASGTRTPQSTTRYLETTRGILSYTELAPHLARRVEALQNRLRQGDYDNHPLEDSLFLDFHGAICADLTPGFAGQWCKQDVVVGTHHPPLPFEVPQYMRLYAQDMTERLRALPETPNDQWLETLAFAGRQPSRALASTWRIDGVSEHMQAMPRYSYGERKLSNQPSACNEETRSCCARATLAVNTHAKGDYLCNR